MKFAFVGFSPFSLVFAYAEMLWDLRSLETTPLCRVQHLCQDASLSCLASFFSLQELPFSLTTPAGSCLAPHRFLLLQSCRRCRGSSTVLAFFAINCDPILTFSMQRFLMKLSTKLIGDSIPISTYCHWRVSQRRVYNWIWHWAVSLRRQLGPSMSALPCARDREARTGWNGASKCLVRIEAFANHA